MTTRKKVKGRRRNEHAVLGENEGAWIGHPVCVVLNDGSYYIGHVLDIKNEELILSGFKGDGRVDPSSGPTRAQVSGFLGSLFGGLGGAPAAGGAAAAPAASAGGSGIGGLGGIMSTIRIGMNVMKMIIPLMSFFKI